MNMSDTRRYQSICDLLSRSRANADRCQKTIDERLWHRRCGGGRCWPTRAPRRGSGGSRLGGGPAWRSPARGRREHAIGEERIGANQSELVKQFPAARWLAWGGEGSPVGLEVEGNVKGIEFLAPLAGAGEANVLDLVIEVFGSVRSWMRLTSY
jgi:hypothetical protein